jgi:hypothetical protein
MVSVLMVSASGHPTSVTVHSINFGDSALVFNFGDSALQRNIGDSALRATSVTGNIGDSALRATSVTVHTTRRYRGNIGDSNIGDSALHSALQR